MLLLFAQPLTRIVNLTVDDVLCSPHCRGQDDGQADVYLRLGNAPTPVPQPLAGLLVELVGARANMNTASNPGSNWLFPGGRAGQPLTHCSNASKPSDCLRSRPAPQRPANLS